MSLVPRTRSLPTKLESLAPTVADLTDAIRNISESPDGRGGFAEVYKGQLKLSCVIEDDAGVDISELSITVALKQLKENFSLVSQSAGTTAVQEDLEKVSKDFGRCFLWSLHCFSF